MPARVHGGPDSAGVVPHDFSTNANACGPCPSALQAVRNADPTRYPDPAYAELHAQLAALHGVAPARIVLAASASEFIFRVTACVARAGGTRVAWPLHHYGDYSAAAQAYDLVPSAQAEADLCWACDPSSPWGDSEEVLHVPGIRVLDRAYAPLRLEGASAWDAPGMLDRAWQLWTPNKALGLTGVRAAYAIAPEEGGALLPALQAACPSWPLGAHGVAMLSAWCTPAVQAWVADGLPVLRAWKARQLALCAALGWPVRPSVANFFCAQGVPVQALRAHGIRVRDAASFGLPGWARLSVQPPAAQDALDNAGRQIAETHR